jgi:triacylglycerol lipase
MLRASNRQKRLQIRSDVLAAHLSLAAYNEPTADHISKLQSFGFDRVEFVADRTSDTEGYVLLNDRVSIVAARGTEPLHIEDWISDLRCTQIHHRFGRVHRGFSIAYASVRKQIRKLLKPVPRLRPVIFTGHSLGAAISTIASADYLDEFVHTHLITFGSPRVGDRKFAEHLNRSVWTRRHVNNNDIVPRCPYVGYFHVGNCSYFDRNGNCSYNPPFRRMVWDSIVGRIRDLGSAGSDGVKDHSMNKYLSLMEKHACGG